MVRQCNYLGSVVCANGASKPDIDHRISIARYRFYRLKAMWSDKSLSHYLKIRLYMARIASTACYGCEAWKLQTQDRKTLNHFHISCMSTILSVDAKTAAHHPTAARHSLLQHVDRRRWSFLGHLLRLPPTRMVRQALDREDHNDAANLSGMSPWPWEAASAAAQDRNKWYLLFNERRVL
jgi:hypothetical protein